MIAVGTCECGARVERERAEGRFAEIANKLSFRCPRCIREAERREEDEQRRRQVLASRDFFEHKVATCLPPALRGRRLADLDTEGRANVLGDAGRWARGELGGLLLVGDVGTGKTTIAAAAVCEYIWSHLHAKTPRWFSTTLALSHLGRSYGDREREATLKALTDPRAPLVLDDLDKGRPNAFAAEQLFNAIDLAQVHERSLLVTANLTPTRLAESWPEPHGEAIASRLVGYCETYQVAGRDRRQSA
jgi:DNA replication protein DnaC